MLHSSWQSSSRLTLKSTRSPRDWSPHIHTSVAHVSLYAPRLHTNTFGITSYLLPWCAANTTWIIYVFILFLAALIKGTRLPGQPHHLIRCWSFMMPCWVQTSAEPWLQPQRRHQSSSYVCIYVDEHEIDHVKEDTRVLTVCECECGWGNIVKHFDYR